MASKISKAYAEPNLHRKSLLTIIIALLCLCLLVTIFFFPEIQMLNYIPILKDVQFYSDKTLKIATWNIAAINNNPFEYWITPTDIEGNVIDDPVYNNLMVKVSSFIESPGEYDLLISSLITDSMFQKLEDTMLSVGWSTENIATTRSIWENDYKNRKIISGFIKDSLIGKKRLASMPDRVTNTIITRSDVERVAMRPTVINCFEGDLGTLNKWWDEWINFMFHKTLSVERKGKLSTLRVYQMISDIKKSKYPSITVEEEKASIPLQTLSLAIFDAILVHMMNTLAEGKWQPLRNEMCNKLNRNKFNRTIDILQTTYKDQDIIFLQEVASSFAYGVSQKPLQQYFDLFYPQVLDGDRDQNSFILLRKGKFSSVHEVTDLVLAELNSISSSAPVAKGDLLALTVKCSTNGKKYLLGSFHGDTNGLATIPIVTAMHSYAVSKVPDHHLLFGLDANTYEKPEADQQGMTDFAKFFTSKMLSSSRGQEPDPKDFTTFNARTHLQPQLNKELSVACYSTRI